jgi:hypothetical protein
MKSLAISIVALSLCACNTVGSVSKDTYWTSAMHETDRVNRATAFCESQSKEYVAVMESAGQLVFRCVDKSPPTTTRVDEGGAPQRQAGG